MKIQFLVLGLWALLELSLVISLIASYDETGYTDGSSFVYEYNRLAEIEKHCSVFLSAASQLDPNDPSNHKKMSELSFYNGDWEQDHKRFPLIPFDESDFPRNVLPPHIPLKLVNFEVKDVNSVQQLKNAVTIGGVLSIGITKNSTFGADPKSKFYMRAGMSVLTIVFEGVYIETEENGGQRLLCLLGNSTLPAWKWVEDPLVFPNAYSSTFNPQPRGPRLLQDDQIRLVLNYPRVFNLTRRAIRGEMTSLLQEGNPTYFDKVYIYSQLGQNSRYEFSSESFELGACDEGVYQQELMEDGVSILNAPEACKILKEISREALSLLPYNTSHNRYVESSEMQPFLLGREAESIDKSYKNVRLLLQNFKCEQDMSQNITNDAKVSAVFRVIPASMHLGMAASRSGLSGMTLSAEGKWDSSSGQLCMTACLGMAGSGLAGCNSKISLYFPRALSIKQRGIVFGSIRSVVNDKGPLSTVLFTAILSPFLLEYRYGWYAHSYLSYNYSKTDTANEFRGRSRQPSINSVVGRQILKYPAPQGRGLFAELYDLTDDLSISVDAVVDKIRLVIKLEVLSLGPHLARYDFLHNKARYGNSPVYADNYFNKYELLNVSLHLSLKEVPLGYSWNEHKIDAYMFLEGVYDPLDGMMYLTGCGKADRGVNMERGLDCLNDVKIEYPPTNTRWLRNPTYRISITSQRSQSDPLYFIPINIETIMVKYDQHAEDLAFRNIFEGIVRIVILVAVIAITWSQHCYVKDHVDIIPYISLGMLNFQVIGFGLPLITGFEILFISKESETFRNRYSLHDYRHLLRILVSAGWLLSLAAMLLILRLSKKVSESRKGIAADDESSEPQPPIANQHILLVILLLVFLDVLVFLAIVLLIGGFEILLKLAVHIQDLFPLLQIFNKWSLYIHDKSLIYSTALDASPILRLAVLSLILWFYKKRLASQNRSDDYETLATQNPPIDRRSIVKLLLCMLAQIAGRSLTWFVVQSMPFIKVTAPKLLKWPVEPQWLAGSLLDCFLIPQILDNWFWKIQVKSLRRTYYIGLTTLRVILKMYDGISDPVPDPFFQKVETMSSNSSYFTRLCSPDVLLLIALASVIHFQQNPKR